MRKYYLLLLIIFYSNYLFSQEVQGDYYTKFYSPEDYGSSSQNWAIVQDNNGVMYFGNNSTILEYDGTEWRQTDLSNNSIVRSITIDKRDKVFVGGVNQFGFLSIDSLGNHVYNSLSDSLSDEYKEFKDVWKTYAISDRVYFICSSYIFVWNYKKITVIEVDLAGMFGYVVHEKLFIVDKNKGFCFLNKNNELIKLPHTEYYKKSFGRFLALPYNDKVLFFTSKKGSFIYDINQLPINPSEQIDNNNISKTILQKFYIQDSVFLHEKLFYNAIKLANDKYAFNTLLDGVLIIDKNGNTVEHLNSNKTLNNDCVYDVFQDNNNNIWAVLQKGILFINYNSPINFFSKKRGLNNYILSTVLHNNKRYVGTLQGVFFIENEKKITSKSNSFQPLGKIVNECWYFYSKKNILLALGSFGIVQIFEDNSISQLALPGLVMTYEEIEKNENFIFIGLQKGIKCLEMKNTPYKKLDLEVHEFAKEIDEQIIKITSDNNNNLWVTTNYNGLYYIEFDNLDSDNIPESIKKNKITHFDTTSGLPGMNYNYVYKLNNKIYVATALGIYEPYIAEGTNKYKFEPTEDFLGYFRSDSLNTTQIYEINQNKYLLNSDRFGFLQSQNNGFYFNDTPFVNVPSAFRFFVEDSIVWFCSSDGLFSYNLNYKKNHQRSYKTLIRKITIKEDSLIFAGNNISDFTNNCILKYKENSITFKYSATFYEENDAIQYSYFLEGFSNKWSKWNSENKAIFTNLHEGNYIFKVKAKNIYENESSIAKFEFKIKPPWFRTVWAYLGYLILLVLLIFIIVKLALQRVVKQKEKLEIIVKERTAEIFQQKEEIQAQAEELLIQKDSIQAQAEKLKIQNVEIQNQSEELKVINQELEKLSIVASETDNAVFIFDNKLNLQWTNDAFYKIYGYTFEEFTANGNVNLLENSTNLDIEEIVKKSIAARKSAMYEAQNKTKSGKEIWVQTNLTPIFENDKLTKIIAIESDITEIKNAQIEISQKNRFITSSINYAKTIQNAILPISEKINENLENFIIFRPKDIVSGDFYWYKKMPNFCLLSVLDCTGHGVPGAFMSMIGNTLLNEIVNKEQVYSPAKILTRLNEEIQKALKQDVSDNSDGMDVCFTKIEKCENENIKIIFSGAKRSLFVYYSDENNIIKYSGDRKSVGGLSKNNVSFTNQEFILQKNDLIVLTTDGFVDQNNSDRKRFGTKHFMRLIEKNGKSDLPLIKHKLENELDKWQGDEKQRDDITVIGIKV